MNTKHAMMCAKDKKSITRHKPINVKVITKTENYTNNSLHMVVRTRNVWNRTL